MDDNERTYGDQSDAAAAEEAQVSPPKEEVHPTDDGPKYPDITVTLVGQDGNVFNLLGICKMAMRKHGIANQFEIFHKEATSGDYDHALQTMMAWFNVE